MSTASAPDSDDAPQTPGPDEVYCRDCGSIIDERAEICPECGVRQRSAGFAGVDESGVAAIASLLIPGAGQIFLGHLERGLLFIAATFVAAFMSMFLVGIPALIAIWLYAVYDAYKLGQDPTRAGRVWGADPGATPITDSPPTDRTARGGDRSVRHDNTAGHGPTTGTEDSTGATGDESSGTESER